MIPPAALGFKRLRKPQKLFSFFEKKLLTRNQERVECPQIEATTAETKTKNQNEKMNAQPTATIVDIEDNSRLKVVLTTPIHGMMQVFRAHGYKCIGSNRNTYGRAELQGLPKYSELVGPMWGGDGNIRYETWAAYNDISADIS